MGIFFFSFQQDVKYDIRTHLCILTSCQRLETGKSVNCIYTIIDHIIEFEKTFNEIIFIDNRQELMELVDIEDWEMKYFVSPLPEEAIPKQVKEKSKIRKSIMWEDVLTPKKKLDDHRKSSIRFSFDDTNRKVQVRRTSILKEPSERIVLPPIQRKDQRK